VDPLWLIQEYNRQLDIDVSRFLGTLDEVAIFKCEDTGYLYYRPFSLAGDSGFYRDLQRHPWYYMDWKWEHETALRYLLPDMRVLEIGCGEGGFLQRAGKSAVGLELNANAARAGRARGLNVLTETIEVHVQEHKAEYDAVCSFQVLEHISKVWEFVTSSVQALQVGGLLIVSVPNNDSFIFREFRPILNYPPHHMGLWSVNSLLGLQKIAAIRAEAVHFEPLQRYHLGYGTDFLHRQLSGAHASIVQSAAAKFERLLLHELPPLEQISEAACAAIAPYLAGHSVFIVFRRTA